MNLYRTLLEEMACLLVLWTIFYGKNDKLVQFNEKLFVELNQFLLFWLAVAVDTQCLSERNEISRMFLGWYAANKTILVLAKILA